MSITKEHFLYCDIQVGNKNATLLKNYRLSDS